ncbi:MAG TPA: SAM-dependent methyltransferase [Pyrinomonadaceae bacterium]|jgi:SAM-dependent MidA family methyltransferase
MIDIASNTSLAARLRERITREGPITFRDWMNAALYDPSDGYYHRSDLKKWGRAGDYRTSSERSSLFAATFARYFATLHEKLGAPATWTIVEAGAGEGHFVQRVMQTLADYFPQVFAATRYVLDEVAAASRARALKRLQSFGDRVSVGKLADLQIDQGVVFSNELLDALPVHRAMLDQDELKEFYVNVDASGEFQWELGKLSASLQSQLDEYLRTIEAEPAEGQVFEVNLEIEAWLRSVADSLRRGYVVTVDYGAYGAGLLSQAAAQLGTLRGFRSHEFVDDLLKDPGGHDLTTSVNWDFVKNCGTRFGLDVVEFDRQDRFLLEHGFLEQLSRETAHAETDADRLQLSTAAREMILPGGMAAHFQVLVQEKKNCRGGPVCPPSHP